ncbi:hypothetical protein [Pontibacter sp. G13]|uniref:hypothetical protein n=1 Tax=Pontibacter sp. G13 TaxID=3074898 RepID=UPI00288BAB31|nr:hypothetical protein [Pontibacter sp. G13]WNJ16028.1 hypothetical protein RJD25_14290 [Pontibacter sp. G13]
MNNLSHNPSMIHHPKWILLLGLIWLWGAIPSLGQNFPYTYEHEIHLKDGQVIRGTIVRQIPGEAIHLQLANESLYIIEQDKIASIEVQEGRLQQLNRSYNFNRNIIKIPRNRAFATIDFRFFSVPAAVGEWNALGVSISGNVGYRFQSQTSIGGGIGYQSFSTGTIVPVYLEATQTIGTGVISPFGGVRFGYAFAANTAWRVNLASGGLHSQLYFGMKRRTYKSTEFGASIGIQYQESSFIPNVGPGIGEWLPFNIFSSFLQFYFGF